MLSMPSIFFSIFYLACRVGRGPTNKLLHGVKYQTFNPSYIYISIYRQQIKTDQYIYQTVTHDCTFVLFVLLNIPTCERCVLTFRADLYS